MSTVTEPKSRKLLGVALFAVTALLLTSCSTPADLTKSDVVGAWTSAGPDVVASWTFFENGTFELDDVPLNTLSGCYPVGPPPGDDEKPDWTVLTSTTGEWQIGGVDGTWRYLLINLATSDSCTGLNGEHIWIENGKLFTLIDPASDNNIKFEYSKDLRNPGVDPAPWQQNGNT